MRRWEEAHHGPMIMDQNFRFVGGIPMLLSFAASCAFCWQTSDGSARSSREMWRYDTVESRWKNLPRGHLEPKVEYKSEWGLLHVRRAPIIMFCSITEQSCRKRHHFGTCIPYLPFTRAWGYHDGWNYSDVPREGWSAQACYKFVPSPPSSPGRSRRSEGKGRIGG